MDVHGRGEQYVAGTGTGLGCQHCAEFLDQVLVPGGA